MTSCLISDLRGKIWALLMVRNKNCEDLKHGLYRTLLCLGLIAWRNHNSEVQELEFTFIVKAIDECWESLQRVDTKGLSRILQSFSY